MIWNHSDNLYPADAQSAILNQFNTDNYSIKVGYIFDPDSSEIGSVLMYHIVNNITGVIEYQGSYLPSTIMHMQQLDKAMVDLTRTYVENPDLPNLILN